MRIGRSFAGVNDANPGLSLNFLGGRDVLTIGQYGQVIAQDSRPTPKPLVRLQLGWIERHCL